MEAIDLEMQKARFKQIVSDWIKRDGIDRLMDYLEHSDFYTAPASTKYHGAYPGGLCEHSIDVFLFICKLNDAMIPKEKVEFESLAICALFHDLCKVNFYKIEMRNKKNADGKWIEVPFYTIDEKYPFGGHGSKSVFLAQQFITLKPDEAAAINNHMGFSAGNSDAVKYASAAFERYPLAWITHVADEAATYLLDRRYDGQTEIVTSAKPAE